LEQIVWKFLFSSNGRISRKSFWYFLVAYTAALIVAEMVDQAIGLYSAEDEIGVISGLLSLLGVWPSIAISIKRFHDRDMSGWWVLWFIMLTIILIFLLFGLPTSGSLFGDAGPSILTWLIISTAVIVQIVQFIILAFLPGKHGENKYGPDPLEKH
jgi:uncharacterized membrane protein YhaH (DUF805 family)